MRQSILLFTAVCSIALLIVADRYFIRETLRSDVVEMHRASELAERWMKIVEEEKVRRLGNAGEAISLLHGGLLGEEYSEITTTLGSLEAKELSLRPDFAALMVRLLHDAGVDSNAVVGLMLSGSFPAIAISTLAALQTLGVHTVITSSLGASSYGANQPEATWIDIEGWLGKRGSLKLRSTLVSLGAEADTGGGLSEEGIALLQDAAKRNGVQIYNSGDLKTAIDERVSLFTDAKIQLLINIGGNQTALGGCVHASTIPYGYHRHLRTCQDRDRGVLARMNESGIPVIHILNIRSLAADYHFPSNPSKSATRFSGVYYEQRPQSGYIALCIAVIVSFVIVAGRAKNKKKG